MSGPQLSPLRVNPKTQEPYLQLPAPHDNIIITPARMSDADDIIRCLNDFAIYKWLEGPPFPYLPSHADEWLATVTSESNTILEELGVAAKNNPDGPPILVSSCPVRILREVLKDGSEVFLGDLGTPRCCYPEYNPGFEKEKLHEKNLSRPVGDPEIDWCIGYYLASSHHGRGIMSVALGTIVNDWMVPRMGAKTIKGEAYSDNWGSRKVFEKNGFKLLKTVEFEGGRHLKNGQIKEGMCVYVYKS